MSVRLYISMDGTGYAARVQWPGFAPSWLEAKSPEELDQAFNAYVEGIREKANRKAVAPVSRKSGLIVSEYARARLTLCEATGAAPYQANANAVPSVAGGA